MITVISFPMAFAQHHGGEQAPPISFGDGQVTVSTSIFPMDFIPDENSSVDLRIRFYDTYSNMNIESTTYRVQIFSGTDLVANQMFFDKDGHLDIKIQPNSNCENDVLWKCTKYHGEQDPIVPNALTSSASSKPVIIGPVFDKSGDYTVKTSIIGAKNPKTQTEKDIVFETKITIPSKQQFPITFNGVEYPVIIKNFETSLNDFNFDESSNSFVFQIPYNWSHLDQTDTIKSYFEFPKNFPPFENVYGFVGKANHDVVLEGSIHYDEYSKKDNNIIHFIIDQNHLKEIDKDSQQIKIAISPLPTSSTVKEELIFDNGFKAIFVYDSNIKNNSEFGFHIAFFDQDNNLASNVRYVYGLKNPSENEIMNVGQNPNRLGIELPTGMETRTVGALNNEEYHIQIGLIGQDDRNFDRLMFEEFDLILTALSPIEINQKPNIPSWIKNNAGWWAEGKIDETSFVQGIQFLIRERIVEIPEIVLESKGNSDEIPSWIKNNAGWWAQGLISDDDFLKGIQFMIENGIIIV